MSSSRATSSGTVIGIDIGGTKVLGVALGPGGVVLAETRRPTPRSVGPGRIEDHEVPRAVAAAVVEVVRELDAHGGASGSGEHGPVPVGIGVPGMVDAAGELVVAPNLPAAAGVHVGHLVAAELPGRTLDVENDANCAAVAEHRLGAGRGTSSLLLVTLGTGIGGGVIVGGQLVKGAAGFAGEVGHMVVDPDGPLCPCGRRGCWERYASGSGLGRLARDAATAGRLPQVVRGAGGDPEVVRGEDVTAAAGLGDPDAIAVFEEFGQWIAMGLANLTAVLDPECIVVAGGLAEVGELLLEPIRRAFAELVEGGSSRPAIDIQAARFGDRAGAVGAALLVGGVTGTGRP